MTFSSYILKEGLSKNKSYATPFSFKLLRLHSNVNLLHTKNKKNSLQYILLDRHFFNQQKGFQTEQYGKTVTLWPASLIESKFSATAEVNRL